MKVYELMSVLAAQKANDEIVVHTDGLLSSEITKVTTDEAPDMVHLYLADPQFDSEDESLIA